MPLGLAGGVCQETLGILTGPQQFLDSPPQRRIPSTGSVQVRGPLRLGESPGCAKDSQLALERVCHGVDRMFYQTVRKTREKGATDLDAASPLGKNQRQKCFCGHFLNCW